MKVSDLLEKRSKSLSALAERRARALRIECKQIGIAPSQARLVVLWGGGKDSTLALVLASAIAQSVDCSLVAATMVHPGLSPGTIENIHRTRDSLNIFHEWRQFTKVLSSHESVDHCWYSLYGRLARATALHPRFMCVACNCGSLVVEFQALTDNRATFCITGNPVRELMEFERWATDLRVQFRDSVTFQPALGSSMLDYYRLWWAIYSEMLRELDGVAPDDEVAANRTASLRDLLYEFPYKDHPVGNVRSFSVLEDTEHSYTPVDSREVLAALGWLLPDDIQGGTESDCMMPSAIAAIDIRRHNLAHYLDQLDKVAHVLKPLPEMHDRAIMWARSGRSVIEGEALLRVMGVRPAESGDRLKGTPIAMALVNQLLPVR